MRRVSMMGAVLSGVLLLAACGAGGSGGGDAGAGGDSGGAGRGGESGSARAKASAAVLSIEPGDGAKDVAPGAVKVSVATGKLTGVTVTDQDGKPVEGALAPDGLTWTPVTGGLSVGSTYRVNAEATDADGVATAATSTFTTLVPKKTTKVEDNVVTGQDFGVGMIISVDFGGVKVKNKAAVEQAIVVEASDGTQVRGHWFENDTRLDLRPAEYWKPGTTVQVHLRTKSVELAPGVYGATQRDEHFTIARSRISEVDAAAHRMVVKEDGKPDQTIPIVAGTDDNPSWNGTMVISAKSRMERMTSKGQVGLKGPGYDTVDPHAMRLTSSGTYLHGNPEAQGVAGHGNISHGCIGILDTPEGDENSPAGKVYAASKIGDVVIVRNSVKKQPLDPANGLSGWTLPWSQW
ncbi:lipoprotein-anchoring transpeptidase ErfK/SrfK [Kitasatospora sp. SolWspMP-SS2h]|uniref:L,D-transpeptidase n=1 Tax=Kitasatospora sp. SolWspMP-SS2h TaxID=1305729 RepID=UPI000DBFCC14|nr:Ig-like domain-containing protein [Kitasatospora sp. SolWspMP-SS2h]RAJ42244.1 lipoprotein-anchoring transpeptidase ErfK/SrfK [Kitasatospora sp. SolWspMP-SS2h]